jgi:anaerobic selenocysteine-containing dehydrogenase
MHNYHRLVKGKDRCSLLMHPDDMLPRDIEDGVDVTVSSRAGSVRVRVESSADVMPGVVSLPHGWGHDRAGIRMDIARRHAGVSCNDVTDELALDALSGNAAVNGVLVSVAPA